MCGEGRPRSRPMPPGFDSRFLRPAAVRDRIRRFRASRNGDRYAFGPGQFVSQGSPHARRLSIARVAARRAIECVLTTTVDAGSRRGTQSPPQTVDHALAAEVGLEYHRSAARTRAQCGSGTTSLVQCAARFRLDFRAQVDSSAAPIDPSGVRELYSSVRRGVDSDVGLAERSDRNGPCCLRPLRPGSAVRSDRLSAVRTAAGP